MRAEERNGSVTAGTRLAVLGILGPILFGLGVVHPRMALAAVDCAGSGVQCNVEATIQGGFLEQGVQSTFATVGGNTAQQRVNSVMLSDVNVCLFSGGLTFPDQVELGWVQDVGDASPHYFLFYCIDGIYNVLKEGPISGTHKYRVQYYAPLNRWDFIIDSGSFWSTHVGAGTWNANHPATNAERDSRSDSFTVGPAFKALYYRTSSTWYTWSQLGAKCFLDNDPDLYNNIRMDIDTVVVQLGAGAC